MLIKYNFQRSRPNPIAGMYEQVRKRLPHLDVVWDSELKFYDTVFADVLSKREKATFRAVAEKPFSLRLPTARELPLFITKESDPTCKEYWGSIELTGFWGGMLKEFPKMSAALNNAPSYQAFLDGALSYYCSVGGLEHYCSMYHLGSLNQGKVVEVPKRH